MPEPGPSFDDWVREKYGREEIEAAAEEWAAKEAAREEEEARQRRKRFPRAGVERKTYSQICEAADKAERYLGLVAFKDVSNWTVAEGLDSVAKYYREAGSLAAELADHMRPPRR